MAPSARRRGPVDEPAPPRIDDLPVVSLVDGDAASLSGDDSREAERYRSADLTGRDLAHAAFTECAFEGVRLDAADLTGASFAGCRLTELDAAVLRGPRSGWRGTTVTASRVGAAELYETEWRSVVVRDSKVGFLNARAARWRDVLLVDTVLDELDLTGATLDRVALPGCTVATLRVGGARLTDVDLRGADLGQVEGVAGLAGATVSDDQLVRLSPALAAHLRIGVR